jgi:integrase/recombinase XerD
MAVSIPRRAKEMTPKPPPRHGNQRGSLSAKAARLYRLFEDDVRLRFGESTGAGYLRHVRVLLLWLEGRGVAVVDVRTADLAAYQGQLLAARKADGRPFSSGHQVNVVKAIKAFFRFLYRRGYALHDPAARLDYPRVEKRLPRTILTPEEARKIIEAPDRTLLGIRDRAILETLYATGIRVSELARLTPHDVDTEERVVRVVMGRAAATETSPSRVRPRRPSRHTS